MLEDCRDEHAHPAPVIADGAAFRVAGDRTPCAKTWHPRRASAGRVACADSRARRSRGSPARREMSVQREILLATRETGEQARFLLEVFNEHWTSTLARLDARGEPEPTRVAPRFYGLTAEQARSRLEPAGKIPCA